MAHKMSLCMHRDDTKLSPLALIDLFHPLTGTCHVTALWCGLFLVVCFWFCVFVFLLCLVFFCVVFVSLFFGVSFCFLGERDSA